MQAENASPPSEALQLAEQNRSLATELAAARNQLNQISEAGKTAAKNDAINQVLSGYNVASDAAKQQLVELLGKDIQVHTQDGRFVPLGPGLAPLDQTIHERLSQPAFGHFLKGGSPPPLTPPINSDGRPAGVGDWIMSSAARHVAAQQGDPRTAMNLPMGLGRPVPR